MNTEVTQRIQNILSDCFRMLDEHVGYQELYEQLYPRIASLHEENRRFRAAYINHNNNDLTEPFSSETDVPSGLVAPAEDASSEGTALLEQLEGVLAFASEQAERSRDLYCGACIAIERLEGESRFLRGAKAT
ncbi:hypothetical protein HGRIS_001311 [Hohenbuehelia grisea]|uniref:Uncharacterized protein n=1 Tax=Hohenbuehelia grisea TaxID=104357 RepID=A0ABR3JQG3_9AGAR